MWRPTVHNEFKYFKGFSLKFLPKMVKLWSKDGTSSSLVHRNKRRNNRFFMRVVFVRPLVVVADIKLYGI